MTDTLYDPNALLKPPADGAAPAHQVDVLNQEAWELRRSDAEQALKLSQDAYALATSEGYQEGQAYSLLTQGFACLRLSNLKTALEKTKEAFELLGALSDKEGQRKALNTLGIIYGQAGDLTEALKTFLVTQELCAELGDERGEADALNNIGLVYTYLGDYANALEYHLQSLKLLEDAKTLVNIGNVYFELAQYDAALEKFLTLLESPLLTDKDKHTRALVLDNIARVYSKLNAYDKALSYAQQSLTLMRQLGDKLGAGYTLDDLGGIYLHLGFMQEASDCFNESLQVKKEVGDQKGEAETCIHLGDLYIQQGQAESALDVLHEGLTKAQRAGARAEVYRAHQALAKAYKLNRQFREACVHLEQFATVKDEVFNEMSDLRLYGARARFEVEQAEQDKEIYRLKNVELAEVIDELNALTESLQQANQEKSELLELLERQANEDGLTGLYNRRYLDLQLENEFARARRSGHPLSVAVFDIDNFKQVNDTFSHQVGDEVLKQVSHLLTENVRQIDTVARYGGEELVIIFPETTAEEAVAVCDRIRAAVEGYPWAQINSDLRVTVSTGVSSDLDVPNHEKLVGKADDKLYEAKHNGKNQVRY